MTEAAAPPSLIRPFPMPGAHIRRAYHDLHLAENGTIKERASLGSPARLPRPWDPATCIDPGLRRAVWAWLDDAAEWLNHEYSWDLIAIPTCWPHHPHLVHEIAVVADQRRRAGLSTTSDLLEEWHRYCLPAFVDRMKSRLRNHCEDGHQPWPGRGRHNTYASGTHRSQRTDAYERDTATLARTPRPTQIELPDIGVINLVTGEIRDES